MSVERKHDGGYVVSAMVREPGVAGTFRRSFHYYGYGRGEVRALFVDAITREGLVLA